MSSIAQGVDEADSRLYYGLIAVLVWLPLPVGSNHEWAWSVMEVGVFLLATIWLVKRIRNQVEFSHAFVMAWPAVLCFGLVVVWVYFQTLPLPVSVLAVVSPLALDIHNSAQSTPAVSLDLHATREAAFKSLTYFLLFCLTLQLVSDRSRVRLLARVIVWCGVFQAAYGVLMVLTGLEYGFFVVKEHGLGVATGTFVNSNHFAGYLEMSLAMCVGLLLVEMPKPTDPEWREDRRQMFKSMVGPKARMRLALIIMVAGLVMSGSRMGAMAFTVSLLVAGAFYFAFVRRTARGLLAMLTGLLLAGAAATFYYFGIKSSITRILNILASQDNRLEVANSTLAIAMEFPLTGTGAGSFASVFPMYDAGNVGSNFWSHAHNDYVQFASEFGMIALAFLGLVVLLSLWSAISAQLNRRDWLMQGMGFAGAMAIMSLLIHSAADFNLQIPANAALFVVILALCWTARHLESRARAAMRHRSQTLDDEPDGDIGIVTQST